MTFTNERPLSVDGTRLDTLAYNIESLDGRRRLPDVRNRDVTVPGRHGVIPSLYDDFEPGSIVLRMWVRSSDVNGVRDPLKHPKDQLSENLDRLFELFRPQHRLLDVRQQVGPSSVSRLSWLTNPRMDKSTSSSNVRSNLIINPSMDRSTSTFVFRTNLVANPNMELNVTGWTAFNATVARVPIETANTDGRSWRLDFTTTGVNPVLANTAMPVVAGELYQASANVGSLQVSGTAGTDPRLKIGIRWLDGAAATISEDHSVSYEVTGVYQTTGPVPSWNRIYVSAEAPTGAVTARLLFSPSANAAGDPVPTGSVFCVDAAMFEQPVYDGTYFDGASTTYGTVAWTGTAHNSASQAIRDTVDNWATQSGRGQIFLSGTTSIDPVFGERSLVWRAVDVTDENQAILWQAGTLPNDNLSTRWSASIYVQSDMPDPPQLHLRIAGLDNSNNFVAYATIGSSATSGTASTVMDVGRGWRRFILNGAYTSSLPASVTRVRLQVVANEEIPEGVMFRFDAATLEAAPATPFYFDGDSGDTVGLVYAWDGTAHNSVSRMKGGTVDGWSPLLGTLTHDATLENYPAVAARAGGKYTVSSTSGAYNGSNGVASTTILSDPGTHWNGGAWVYGGGNSDMAQVAIESFNGVTSVATSRGVPTNTNGRWTWVPGPDHLQPGSTDRVRLVVYIWKTGDVYANVGAVVFLGGATLCQGSDPVNYFDELSPGVLIHSGGKFEKLPDVRQASCKTVNAVEPSDVELAADNSLTMKLSVNLEMPDVFWREVNFVKWQSPNQPSNVMRTYEIFNLGGATAPIEDLVFIVNGPGSNCKVVDPETGWFIKLNGWLPKGQSWRVDAGRNLSGVARTGTVWNAENWRNVIGDTDYENGRSRLFTLHPMFDTTLDYNGTPKGFVTRIRMYGGVSMFVLGRRKWL